MNFDWRRNKITVLLIISNVLYFAYAGWIAGTFSGTAWTYALLKTGALFNPYVLDGDYYRLLTHQFLHGHLPHLLLNMVALFSVGKALEPQTGSLRFLAVYLLCGLAAAIASLWWSLFQVSVGASGAIFGLFGFSLVVNIRQARQQNTAWQPILFNFAIFILLNLLLAETFHADTAAHLGGLACGLLLALLFILPNPLPAAIPEAIAFIVLLVLFYSLPQYQVHYFKFFQQVIAQEDSTKALYRQPGITDEAFAEGLKKINIQWTKTEDVLYQLNPVPEPLHHDTAVLKRYIQLRKKEAGYRILLIEKESYIYLDSIEVVSQLNGDLSPIQYPLRMSAPDGDDTPADTVAPKQPVKVFFDSLWNEVPYPPGTYYRIGYRDSLNRWDGPLTDFFADGTIQMKGTYHKNKQDGVFIYYTRHKTYEAAGRLKQGRHVGKWETFYPNGKMESEVFYSDNSYLRSWWNIADQQKIVNGEGEQVLYHSNGNISQRGRYKGGLKEGGWSGYYPDGAPYFDEEYRQGRLIMGRSRSRKGEVVTYDQSSFYPIPKNGFARFYDYVHQKTAPLHYATKGDVEVSFRVTTQGIITNMEIEKSLTAQQDSIARQIILQGPAWYPGKEHGLEPAESYAFVKITF